MMALSILCLCFNSCVDQGSKFDSSQIRGDIKDESKRIVESLVNKDEGAVFKSPHPDIVDLLSNEAIEKQFAYLKGDEILDTNIVNYGLEENLKGADTHLLQIEAETDQGFALITLGLTESDNCCLLRYIETQFDQISYVGKHDFFLQGKPIVHWAFIAVLVFVPLAMIFSLFWLFFKTEYKAKIGWAIFIVIGFHGIIFNWTSGEVSTTFLPHEISPGEFNITFFDLLFFPGVKGERYSALSPWLITIYFPIGVLGFWSFYLNGLRIAKAESKQS